jgi:molybdenum cofactor cytidylyltransferase
MSEQRVAIVVLAAGASRRLGRPKQLLELGGEPLIRHTVRNALASKADAVLVVLGNEADRIGSAIGDLKTEIVHNPDFTRGQSTSMVAGISALGSDVDAAVLMLGDQPGVASSVLDALIDRFVSTRPAVVQPRYADGKPGNPALVSRPLFPELLAVTGDIGAREVIRAHRGEIEYVDVGASHPLDVDTDDDYAALRAAWNASN